MDTNKWQLDGRVFECVYRVSEKGSGYWHLQLKISKGLIGVYVHEPEIRPVAELLQVGQLVRVEGELEPHRNSNTSKPYFLNAKQITVLQQDS